MDLSFANPAGFWALLGLPAIIAIHFLQRQSKSLTISTLFLLEQLTRESVRGRKIERIRHSVPLWLQLLMVLLLTWLLIQPRWIRPESVQRIAIVIDSSASMSAFKKELAGTLRPQLDKLSQNVSRTEYLVIESAIADLTLYNGGSLPEMFAALDNWRPLGGAHDFSESLRIARSLVGGDGLVVLATDHQHDTLPFNASLLAVGRPLPNVGFAGLVITEGADGAPAWRTIVRNYSDTAQTRRWHFFTADQRSPDSPLTLEPGQSRTLEGPFPEGVRQLTLSLEADNFPLDDQLPAVIPQAKRLTLAQLTPASLQPNIDQVVASLDEIEAFQADEETPRLPDLTLFGYDPLSPGLIDGNAIVFLNQQLLTKSYFSGRIAAENHPLVDGLNWQSLIARRSPGAVTGDGDTVLLWQDNRALIFLRNENGARQLFINFDLATSNAGRLPAFIVLIHRFVESLREAKVAPWTANFETGQALNLACHQPTPGDETSAPAALRYRFNPLPQSSADAINQSVPLTQANLLRAPREPGFFTVTQGSETLLTAAASFADTREADLREAGSRNDLSLADAVLIEQHSESDNYWQIWLLLLLTALLIAWHYTERKRPSAPVDELPTPNF